ncbi:LuxR C-terminal-related transcriptional regulator [Dactylosporangium fulvum]|uniref:LuxR C-terminal-related transcriptional regulator n=2 Tax=Dactylosporangium fulvum TaxID=53359 RepID=A0ABY5VQC2_9ACTN|nr:LuxR family transcriptional regulator [Dactylosporangium fulvum]UWP79485.1 LuxR C-terminal-related transcriptional regulator [Dactylosporangium fulvum]
MHDGEYRQLIELLDRARPGPLTVAVVEGPPGSGKTRLLRRFADCARQRPATAVLDAEWSDGLPRLAPAATLVLTCEHPQWIDPRVWPALDALARTTAALVVLARRTGAGWPPGAAARPGAHRVTLGPLPADAVAELLTELLGGRPGPAVVALAGVAAGLPGALGDLAAGLLEERLVTVEDGRAVLVAPRLPARTRARLAQRLAALSAPTRRALQVASTIGPVFGLLELARVMGCGTAALLPAVDEAMTSGLVTGAGDVLMFSHELVRDVVEASLPRPVVVALRGERAHPGVPGWGALTEQEREIAGLVGRALTNQQIARRIGRSPHTVNYHLRQIFRKLGIGSRVELASLYRASTS